MKWWEKPLALAAGTIGWVSIDLLMVWIFNVPVQTAIFCGFIGRVSFSEVFARRLSKKNDSMDRFLQHIGADLVMLPPGFAVLTPSLLTISLAVLGPLLGLGLIFRDELIEYWEQHKLRMFVDHYNATFEDGKWVERTRERLVRARVANLDEELNPKLEERRKLKEELDTIEQKKSYRGNS